jgi:hypothetical protein
MKKSPQRQKEKQFYENTHSIQNSHNDYDLGSNIGQLRAFTDSARSQPATGWRLSQRKHRRGGFCAF